MQSITYGEVSVDQVAEILLQKSLESSSTLDVLIGTDSQNFDKTKVVEVIAVHDVGHGGLFFYNIHRVNRIESVRQKLYYETEMSLDLASRLIESLESLKNTKNFEYEEHLNFCIHVDAGLNGPSKNVIPEIVGWIKSAGYNVAVKPDSFAACSIADKLSK